MHSYDLTPLNRRIVSEFAEEYFLQIFPKFTCLNVFIGLDGSFPIQTFQLSSVPK